MQVNWSDLGAALALYLVLEGIMPLLNPAGLKRMLLSMTQLDNSSLRVFGFCTVAAGLGLLHLVRG
jgi:uncharacterized protein